MNKNRIPVLPEEPLKIGLSLALDLGTETVGAYLYDAAAGRCIAAAGAPNAQKLFGEKLMSRIIYAENEQKFLQETAVLREQVYDLILELCRKAQEQRKGTGEAEQKMLSFADIHYVSIAGNTVMEHLYGAVSPRPIGVPPFLPVTLFGEQIIAEPTMYFSPCISGFAGGDITAGLMSSGLAESDAFSLYIDLGKGFGMALGKKDGFLCGAGAETDEIPEMLEKLLKESGKTAGEIQTVLLAGAFGAEEEETKKICEKAGLSPELLNRAVFAGNAAGFGACMALTAENREKLKKTAAVCRAVI